MTICTSPTPQECDIFEQPVPLPGIKKSQSLEKRVDPSLSNQIRATATRQRT